MANANDRDSVQRSSKLEKAARNAELDGIRQAMITPTGRALMQRLLDKTGVEVATVFNPNAMVLAHDTGLRALGHFLLGEIRAACPEQELVMRREALSQAQRADLQQEFEDDQRDNDR